MITETTYKTTDLSTGICHSCGEESNEILLKDGRCVDCIEAEKFFNETMEGVYDENLNGY